MQLSNSGLSLITNFEGLATTAYKAHPSEKYYTIGYGHYGPDVKPTDKIGQTEAEALLKKDVARFEKGVQTLLKMRNISVSQNQFDALVSFAFNVGIENLNTSTLLKKLTAGDIQGAAAEFLRWNKCGGEVLKGLVKRREAERALFLSK